MILTWSYILLIYITHVYSIDTHTCVGTENACMGQTIECDPTQDCGVKCSGFQACRNTIINCPTDHQCIVECFTASEIDVFSNTLTCFQMIIHAESSKTLKLTANIGDIGSLTEPLRTLEESSIFCPKNGKDPTNPLFPPCQITCDGDDLIRQAQIYAVAGFNDLYIQSTFYNALWCIRAANVHCTPDFTASCSMTNFFPFRCQNLATDKTCDTYTYAPTSSTLAPTPRPTDNPTPTPTFTTPTPTVDPTTNTPTITPTTTPTTTPSNNPTSMPTTTPTTTPTTRPTTTPTSRPTTSPTTSESPTTIPTTATTTPTSTPTTVPTTTPTSMPTTTAPTTIPTQTPTSATHIPTTTPSHTPTYTPTISTINPTTTPTTTSPTTYSPSNTPTTTTPTITPTSLSPTSIPTKTPLNTCCGCFNSTKSPGCEPDPECEIVICSTDNYCCVTKWDEMCVNNAEGICEHGTDAPTTANPTSITSAPTQITNTPTFRPTTTTTEMNIITNDPTHSITNTERKDEKSDNIGSNHRLSTTELLLALLLPLLCVACCFMSGGICLLKNKTASSNRLQRIHRMDTIDRINAQTTCTKDESDGYDENDIDNETINDGDQTETNTAENDDESNSSDLFRPGVRTSKDDGELMKGISYDSYVKLNNKQKTSSGIFTDNSEFKTDDEYIRKEMENKNKNDDYSDSTIDL